MLSHRCVKLKTAAAYLKARARYNFRNYPLSYSYEFAYVTAARDALFNLSNSGGGMLEFPESINERIWETASPSVLSGPSLARPMSIHLRHLTSGNASWRSSGAVPGTCGRCWVRRHFAAKTVAPFRHSRAPIKESRRYPCPFWKKDRRDMRRGWFDNRGSSRHNNFLCSTQIRRLPCLLETNLRTQV